MSLENLSPIEQVRVSRDLHRLKRLGLHAFERFDGKEQQALDAHEEIGAYLNSRSVFERSNIESLSGDLDRPLPDQLSAYVLVPVAAGQEVATLRNTLLQYAKQDADPSTWAIMLYINSTDMGDNRITKADIEQTYQIAREFAQAYPHLTVRITGTTYMDEAPTIGHIRADMWDLALYDVYKHGLTHNNLIGISHDADSEWMSPDYIRRMQEAAGVNPQADILTCRLE